MLCAVTWKEKAIPMLADIVDAVVGIDAYRDLHVAELAGPTGAPLASVQLANTSAGYAELLGWIARHAPRPTGSGGDSLPILADHAGSSSDEVGCVSGGGAGGLRRRSRRAG
jgi:hypothetical protein